MTVILDQEQTQVLREILESTRKELELELARSDTRDFSQLLLRREAIVEALLAQLEPTNRVLADQIS